jgi:hypothetical protein
MNNRYEIRLIDHEITFDTRREKNATSEFIKMCTKSPNCSGNKSMVTVSDQFLAVCATKRNFT